jgi:hypothetical protein
MQALLRYPRRQRSAVARDWGRRGLVAQAAARMARGPDAETRRRRTLEEWRGVVLRHGHTYRADGIVAWEIRRSVAGRTDQYDIVTDGRLWRTGGVRMVQAWTGVTLD